MSRRNRGLRRGLAGLALAALAACAGPDPEALRERARAEIRAGRGDRALEALESLAARVAPTPGDRLLRAHAARVLGRDDDALRELADVPDDDPAGPEARLVEGQVEVRRGRLRLAERAFLRALAREPGLVQARRELIYIYGMQLRRRELAEQFLALSRLGPLTPQQVWLWSMAADLIWWLPDDNQPRLERFLANDPEDRWTRLALAENSRRLGRPDEALRVLEPLPEDDDEARAARALLAIEGNDLERAEALLAGGPPDHVGLARLRGRLALARRDVPAALRALKIAYDAEPWRRDANAALGNAYQLAGDEAQARRYLDRAKRLDALGNLLLKAETKAGAGDPDLFREIAAACESVGRDEEAKAWYRLVITRDPLDRAAQLALHRLEAPPAATP